MFSRMPHHKYNQAIVLNYTNENGHVSKILLFYIKLLNGHVKDFFKFLVHETVEHFLD